MYPDLSGIALVFDYMPHTLYSKLKDDENPLSRQQIQSYMKMLLRGLSYLHDEMKIMHRVSACSALKFYHALHFLSQDIKPANLLISEYDVLRIADFGLARLFNPDEPKKCYSPQVATRW
jgi:cell cycle related kinase